MPANHQTKISGKMKDSIEQAQARLANLEEEAQKVLRELLGKSKATRKEFAHIMQRLNSGQLLEAEVKEWSGKAKNVSADVVQRFDEIRERAIAFAGVASRDQVEDLAKDLERLSKKLDKLAGKKPVKPRAES